MSELGKVLFVIGLVVAATGLLLWSGIGRELAGAAAGATSIIRRQTSAFIFPLSLV